MSYENRPPIEPLRIYSRIEAAEVLNVSLSTIKRLIAAGTLRASKPPGMRRVLIKGQALLELIDENIIDPATYIDDEDE